MQRDEAELRREEAAPVKRLLRNQIVLRQDLLRQQLHQGYRRYGDRLRFSGERPLHRRLHCWSRAAHFLQDGALSMFVCFVCGPRLLFRFLLWRQLVVFRGLLREVRKALSLPCAEVVVAVCAHELLARIQFFSFVEASSARGLLASHAVRQSLHVLPISDVHVFSFGNEALSGLFVVQRVFEDEAFDFLRLLAQFLLARELDRPLLVAVLLVAPVRFFEKQLVFLFLVRL